MRALVKQWPVPLLTLIVALCRPLAGVAQEVEGDPWTADPAAYSPADSSDRSAPRFGWTIDQVAAAIGVPGLRAVSLPDGWVEIRLWTGFGMGMPEHVLRVVIAPDGATGQAFVWWNDPPPRFTQHPDFVTHGEWTPAAFGTIPARSGCHHTHAVDGTSVCEAEFERPVDWDDYARRFLDAGVLAVHDPDDLPGGRPMVLDGVSMLGETLRGSDYRTWTWEYGTTGMWPEGAAVREIWDLTSDIDRHHHAPSVDEAPLVDMLLAASIGQVLSKNPGSGKVRICASRVGRRPETPSPEILARLGAEAESRTAACLPFEEPASGEQLLRIERISWFYPDRPFVTWSFWTGEVLQWGSCFADREGDDGPWRATCE